MLIRYGIVHVLALVAGLPGLLLCVYLSNLLAPPPRKSNSKGREVLADVLSFIGLVSLISIPILIFSQATIVRVVDDGANGELSWRRYWMFGTQAVATTLDGKQIEVTRVPGEITVNATQGPLMLEPVKYAKFQTETVPPPDIRLEPGDAKGFEGHPIFLGPIPKSIEAPAQTVTFVEVYVVRAD